MDCGIENGKIKALWEGKVSQIFALFQKKSYFKISNISEELWNRKGGKINALLKGKRSKFC